MLHYGTIVSMKETNEEIRKILGVIYRKIL